MGETRVIVAGSFIDGSGAAVRRHVFLAVQDGSIIAMGSAADLPHYDGAVIDDFSHCTLVPALVDCSVSLSRSPSVDSGVQVAGDVVTMPTKAVMVARHIHDCHAHGVLGVADASAEDDLLALAQKDMVPGSIIDICSSGCDFIKIFYSGNIEAEALPSFHLCQEDLSRILQDRGNQKAVVVANGRHQVAEALAAGCDAIEQGYAMGEDNLREMAATGVLWIPSLLRAKSALDGARSGGSVCCRFSQRYVAPGKPLPGAEAFWKKTLAEQLRQLRLARKLGVTTALGTGAGSVGILHGESMVEEVKLFIQAGYALEEVMHCGSENGARFFGMERLGALMVGRSATFLITRGSVKQLPRKLSYLEGVYVDGVPSRVYRKNPVKGG
ncbi:MAG: amidohydrolase [Proteobacteria bacterium]|nr:amidohydrolase [Pseudomonadota bacterium]MBU1639194.1 amidohydrolase [Pseudomonadota bacterium]